MEPARHRHEAVSGIERTLMSNSSLFDKANAFLRLLNDLYPNTSGVIIRFDRDPVQSLVVGAVSKLETIWSPGWMVTSSYWGIAGNGPADPGGKTEVPGSIRHDYLIALRELGLERPVWYRWSQEGALSCALLIASEGPTPRSLLNLVEHLRPLIGIAFQDTLRRSCMDEHERMLSGISNSLSHKARLLRGCLTGIRDDRSSSISPEMRVLIEQAELNVSGVAQVAQDIMDFLRLTRAALPLHPISMKTILTETCMQLDDPISRYGTELAIVGPSPIVSVNHMGILLVMRHLIMDAIIRMSPLRAGIRVSVDVSGSEFARVTLSSTAIDRSESDERPERHFHDGGLRQILIRQGIERMGGRCCPEFEDSGDGSVWFELRQYPAMSTHRTQIVSAG